MVAPCGGRRSDDATTRGGRPEAQQAAIGEQVPVTGVEEELGLGDRRRKVAGDLDVTQLVPLHRVNLQRHARRPRASELRERDAGMEEQRAPRARPGLSQHLRRQHAEREPGVDDVRAQILGGGPAAPDDLAEADLLGVGHAAGQIGEGPAVVEIRRVHDVAARAELVGEREAAGRQPMRMMEQDDFGHGACSLAGQTGVSI
jgi:hypothetical protein